MKKEIEIKNQAYIYSLTEPSEEQYLKFKAFLKKKYDLDFDIVWEKKDVKGGFILKVLSDTYDYSSDNELERLKDVISAVPKGTGNIISLLKTAINDFKLPTDPKEIGEVVTVGDGIATVKGLDNVTFGEILIFQGNVRGMVEEISETEIGCVLFDEGDSVYEGSKVYRSHKNAGVPVGEKILGRVIDALGNPIDGLGDIETDSYFEIEHKAPGIIERKPVDTALKTGILSIDSMFPIGRGQRELIIGDRQTGKTQIALDTIINQRDNGVICIYVAIGQKNSTVVRVKETLKRYDALKNTVIVSASASMSSPLQYIAPYSGTAIAEYFMSKGKDVLIVYDDLSKHAVAYRALSLLLGRSPGREAYPGDVFYLHSRLLERSARLNENYGGGSITALPIVETQAGDVAAYIPTNIISITDGQIFLESSLFFSGQRPAVNVGLSVSRVGRAAQTKAMKKAVSTLRLDLAQYREMEVFNQFSSDLDEDTRKKLSHGEKLMGLLRQTLNSPYDEASEIVLLTAALNNAFDKVDILKLDEAKAELLNEFRLYHGDIMKEINETNNLTDERSQEIVTFAKEFFDRLNG